MTVRQVGRQTDRLERCGKMGVGEDLDLILAGGRRAVNREGR